MWSHAGRTPTREGDRQEHHCHLPRGLSAGGCEPHWPGLLTRVGLKSEGREGHRTRPLCRLRAQVVPTPPPGHQCLPCPPCGALHTVTRDSLASHHILRPEVSEKVAESSDCCAGRRQPAAGKVSRASPVPGAWASCSAHSLGQLLSTFHLCSSALLLPPPNPECSQLRREQVKQGSPGPEGQDILHSGEGPSDATWDHDCPERCWIVGGRSCSPCPPCPPPPGSSWYLGLKSTLQGSKGAWVWEQGGQSWDGRREGREKLQEKVGGVFQGPRWALGRLGQGRWAWPSGPHPATPALGGRLHRQGAV